MPSSKDRVNSLTRTLPRLPRQILARQIPRRVRRVLHRRHLSRPGPGAIAPSGKRIRGIHSTACSSQQNVHARLFCCLGADQGEQEKLPKHQYR